MSQQSVLFDAPGPRARRNTMIANLLATIVVLAILAWALVQLQARGQLAPAMWARALEWSAWRDYLLPGLQFTLQAAGISVVAASAFGLVFGFLRLAPIRIVRYLATVVVEFLRAVPVLVMMVFLYTFFASVVAPTGLFLPEDAPYFAVIVALTLYNGSVIAELVRSGVYSLPKGQREAAAAVGMTSSQSLRIVQIPQALTAMLPSLLSQVVVILKDSALGYLIGFYELLNYARQLGSGQGNMLQALVVAAGIFIVINFLLTLVARALASRLSSRTSGSTATKPGPYGPPTVKP